MVFQLKADEWKAGAARHRGRVSAGGGAFSGPAGCFRQGVPSRGPQPAEDQVLPTVRLMTERNYVPEVVAAEGMPALQQAAHAAPVGRDVKRDGDPFNGGEFPRGELRGGGGDYQHGIFRAEMREQRPDGARREDKIPDSVELEDHCPSLAAAKAAGRTAHEAKPDTKEVTPVHWITGLEAPPPESDQSPPEQADVPGTGVLLQLPHHRRVGAGLLPKEL